MLANHTIAQEIIDRHDDPCPILDGKSLAFLQDYVMDASAAHGRELLNARQVMGADEKEVGAQATAKDGCLVEFLIERNLDAGNNGPGKGLTGEEIESLKQWFQSGGAQERIQGWKAGLNA